MSVEQTDTQGAGVLGGRRAGVILHPTSLPGPAPSGTLGEDARGFVRWCAEAGIGVWQVLPLGPCHGDRSPYQCQSVLAGEPMLLDRADALAPHWPVDARGEWPLGDWLRAARASFEAGAAPALRQARAGFEQRTAAWLDDFALFRAVRAAHGQQPWWAWPVALRDRQAEALAAQRRALAEPIADECFAQFLFDRQWHGLREHAGEHGVALFGDAPIFVAEDSAEVWARRDLFLLGSGGRPEVVAGVPPDYFSATGQRWGNPLYDWQAMQADGFAWWLQRLAADLARVDLLRIDHFRGLEAYWAIPAREPTAMNGEWCPAPGAALLEAVAARFGRVPVVAEDLGIITAEVTALRERFMLPGMKVLQFAFGGDASNPYLPHNHEHNCVVYTGTHDNDTTAGWVATLDAAALDHACRYLGCDRHGLAEALLRAAYGSVADLCVLPMQDFLGLGSEARMNTPGVAAGNWSWRFAWEDVAQDLTARLGDYATRYGRVG